MRDFSEIRIRTPTNPIGQSFLACVVNNLKLSDKERLLHKLAEEVKGFIAGYEGRRVIIETDAIVTEKDVDEIADSVEKFMTDEGRIDPPDEDES